MATASGTNAAREGRAGRRLAEFLQRALAERREASPWDDQPIRAELFGVERLEEHARSLARAQATVTDHGLTGRLLRRLGENERVLLAAYADVADAITSGAAITPAAEWLIDNFHLVESQIREIRLDLPAGYVRLLPKLATGPFVGLPRVFGMIWGFVAHTDSLFDPEALRRYVRAYQEVQPLSIGELWAVAITLRVMLVENLRRIAGRVMASRAGRRLADRVAGRLLGSVDRPGEPAQSVLGSLRRDDLTEAFFVQLTQRLRDQDPSVGPALAWIDERLDERGLTADGVVQAEHQRQVAASVTVRNIITSMRLISDVDWSELFERMSLVDDVLGGHDGYALMDFPTRNLYRSAIEDLARGSRRAELEVARAVLMAANVAGATGSAGEDRRIGDPGYYLIAAGRPRFETAIGYRPPLSAAPERISRALGIGGYVGAGASLATLFLAAALGVLAAGGIGWPWPIILGVLGAPPAVDLAVALTNHIVTRGLRATILPALALKEGLPAELRTLVVVPSLLTSAAGVRALVERLEIHHLSSLAGDIQFALLTDWVDAPSESVEGDEALLAEAKARIAELNLRYGPAPGGDRFLLLHRRRVWCESEQVWMGWERKRGKLTELNRLIAGRADTTWLDPPPIPAGVRYVVTLDSDTRLPRESVRRLIGKMAHPLNRPRLDPSARRVVEGYAILQPRVTPALPVGKEASLFLRVFSHASGIDPYAAAVSDVYQDLFGEGSYTGKGVYDVAAFEAALEGRTPESALLSHDLFEGVFARAGLASDVEVVEDFPARYDAAALRHHRWARGDLQLLPWILGFAPRPQGAGAEAGVPMIGRWKMLDNLRRSVSPPATVAALMAGWAAPGDAGLVWTAFLVATWAIPPLLPVVSDLFARRPKGPVQGRWRTVASDLGAALSQIGLMLVFLAHQAWIMGDAILRTLVRLTITRRRLLEWTPAAQAAFGSEPTLLRFYGRMSGALVLAAAALGAAWLGHWRAWPVAAAFAIAWAASPAVALLASLSPATDSGRPLGAADAAALRLIARRTWRFFETFVTADNHMLPPDNFQETPRPVVARRTSPTNIGLYLLAAASARDFGWIGETEALDRLEAAFATMERLERFRGHFLNWYATDDLRPLEPRYVSSVDSGNLAGHLVALAAACREWVSAGPLSDAQRLQGCVDALAIARETLQGLPVSRGAASEARRRLASELDALGDRLAGASEGRWTGVAREVERVADVARQLTIVEGVEACQDIVYWIEAAGRAAVQHEAAASARGREDRLRALAEKSRAMALDMDFSFLLDPDRLLLSIGYQTAEGARDPSCYDLLASEARLASFFAIAKGDVPTRHWFRLGRNTAPTPEGPVLISWSGSMFEYLMPSLVMRAPAVSLIEETNRVVVARQIDYGRRIGTPWGVSESAYNARDLNLTYQYSNFGVPGLGLKRGLADNRVVAPYATALATMVDPPAAAHNFERLAAAGALGRHGYYEALDYTPSRVPEGEAAAVVRCYMAHHQGMSVIAIADALLGGRMRDRFHADPMVQATELLLQERAPRDVVATPPSVAETASAVRDRSADGGWRRASPWSATPDAQILSNGRYSVMLTAAGSGYSTWRDIAITRWREDATSDDWGSYIYLRDVKTGEVWSAGLQPTGVAGTDYAVTFNEDRVILTRRDGDIACGLETLVSSEDDAEVRRLTLTNLGEQPREIEVTSYMELALALPAADQGHPVFSKMFVETEHVPGTGALIAHRRRRADDDPEVWAAHLVAPDARLVGQREFETDRARFLGRGVGVGAPAAVLGGRPLSGSVGAVLDPIFALRRRVRVDPGQGARLDFWLMAAASREAVLALVDKHQDPGAYERAGALAWTQVQVQLHHLGITHAQAGQFQRLAGHLIYAAPTLRPASDLIDAGLGGQPLLWSLGVSGDLPILLVRISDAGEIDLVREALVAVAYLRMRRLAVDLVILNERGTSYVQDLQTSLETLVRANQTRPQGDDEMAPGHIFLLRSDLIAEEARAMLAAAARVVLVGDRGRLADQIERAPEGPSAAIARLRREPAPSELQVGRAAPDLLYYNGIGGFSADGREYVSTIEPGQSTPAPWVNVIANDHFGFQVSAEGAGYAWWGNSREHQITPWSNDPVTDEPSQALFVQDEETGEAWSPTAQPLRDPSGAYVARHGFGYSRFQHASRGVALELVEFAATEDPVRISRLSIRNTSSRRRRLSVTAYVEWALGASRAVAAPFIITSLDTETGALFATNRWYPAYAGRVAFIDVGGRQTSGTGDRREFIGRNGSLAAPAALQTSGPLSGRTGAGLDPCGALRAPLVLEPGASVDLPIFLGEAASAAEARALVRRWRAADLGAELAAVKARWDGLTCALQVKTPDQTLDLMLNGWLIYQVVSARLWARCGFYQASGAYGFRDQLQDVMALAAIEPGLTRAQLLRAAARQFGEGDTQHWWLPDTGQGVRTRISDDRVWLAFVALHYIEVSGDGAVLDEQVPFLEGPVLEPGQVESFFAPGAGASASLFEHCARGLDASLAVGAHGAPLMGSGDWNDGMNRVGVGGRGESVWLGWFLLATLKPFAAIAERRGEARRAAAWRARSADLEAALEREAWDGDWYKRAWFDDGTPLGSAANEECRIDSIAQSWAVLSGAADPARAARAMAAAERELIQAQENLALLFTPAFDHGAVDPGYVKAYPPGVRENGGQYTHAAAWAVMAFAALGEGDKAAALFWILNPINHARTRSDAYRYRVEPYVLAADVYEGPGRTGRGGWTWYTGSAAWLYRAGVESILGLRVRGQSLEIDPCIPRSWPKFEATLRRGAARYEVVVLNPGGASRGVASATLDGQPLSGRPVLVPIGDDGAVHRIEVTLGDPRAAEPAGT